MQFSPLAEGWPFVMLRHIYKKNWIKTILAFCLWLSPLSAWSRPGPQNSMRSGFDPSLMGGATTVSRPFQAIMPNPSDEARRAIIQELLGANTPLLAWPAFPRTWTQFTDSTFIDTSTSLGLSVNAIAEKLGLGLLSTVATAGVTYKPYNFSYRYTFDTTLVVMSSLRSSRAGQVVDGVVQVARDEETLRTIFDLDPQINNNF